MVHGSFSATSFFSGSVFTITEIPFYWGIETNKSSHWLNWARPFLPESVTSVPPWPTCLTETIRGGFILSHDRVGRQPSKSVTLWVSGRSFSCHCGTRNENWYSGVRNQILSPVSGLDSTTQYQFSPSAPLPRISLKVGTWGKKICSWASIATEFLITCVL